MNVFFGILYLVTVYVNYIIENENLQYLPKKSNHQPSLTSLKKVRERERNLEI